MTRWVRVADETFVLHAGIAIQPVDDFTGGAPAGPVTIALEVQDGAAWHLVPTTPVRSPSGVHAWPGLGRHPDPAATPMRRYRAQIEAGHYRPAYRWTLDGLEFDVPSYNDTHPPAFTPLLPERAALYPGTGYAFPAYMRVLRGRVEDGAGTAVADAQVSSAGERVLTDSRGAFALPLRWPARDALIAVEADHARSGRTALVNLQLPGALEISQTLVVA